MGKHRWRDDDPLLPSSGERKRNSSRWLFWIAIILLLLLIAGGTAYYTYWVNFKHLEKPEVAEAEPPVIVLILGIDKRERDIGRADTIMVASIDPKYKTIRLISLPRDTRATIPGFAGQSRINAAYGYGGAELVEQTVENLLKLEIDYYVATDFQGFAKIIDAVGGVEIDVEKAMDYDDYAQGLHIHLKPGRQRLSGEEALQYVRFRGDGLGDISLVDPVNNVYEGRIERQQKFVKAVAEQILDPANIWKAPALIRRLADALDTNMPMTTILRYAAIVQNIPTSNIFTSVLPGSAQTINGASYWVPDEAQVARLVQSMQRPTPPPVVQEDEQTTRPIRVRVLNGSGAPGAARSAKNFLTQQGFDVVEIGNANSFNYQQTEIIMHIPSDVAVSRIRQILRVYGTVTQDFRADESVDVTVILGRDYHGNV